MFLFVAILTLIILLVFILTKLINLSFVLSKKAPQQAARILIAIHLVLLSIAFMAAVYGGINLLANLIDDRLGDRSSLIVLPTKGLINIVPLKNLSLFRSPRNICS